MVKSKSVLPQTIAIDGPAASGKSTIGCLLAKELDYKFLDTGVMYRAVAAAAWREEISVTDEHLLVKLTELLSINIWKPKDCEGDSRNYTVFIGDKDVTSYLRDSEVDLRVSTVAKCQAVREALVKKQQGMAEPPIVMVGRDITTIVLPNADVKIYLDAPLEVRADHRWKELRKDGQRATFAKVKSAMKKRDKQDEHVLERAKAAISAGSVIHINSDGLGIEEVLERILAVVTSHPSRS